jgi:hypothetical protein
MSKSQDEPDDGLGDDIPWADPAIRTDYETALGRFRLAFNEVDHRFQANACLDVDEPLLPS